MPSIIARPILLVPRRSIPGAAAADKPNSMNPSASSLPRVVPLSGPSGCCYTLRLNGHEVLVDAGNKGKPGDVVKKCPVIVRRLAHMTPYPGEAVGPAGVAMLSDRFYYAVPGDRLHVRRGL